MYTARKFTPFLFVFLLPLFAHATLYRDLSLGSQGEDVRELQQLLNANSGTQIVASGPGSPGQETTYFGSLTQSAVIRYQNLYASQILAPLGLFSGTGYVGASTRSHITASSVAPASVASTTGGTVSRNVTAQKGQGQSFVSEEEAQDRNEENKEIFIDEVRRVLEEDGRAESEIDAVEDVLREQAETPVTELQKDFEKGRARFGTATRTPDQILKDAKTVAPLSLNIPDKNPLAVLVQDLAGFLSLSPQTAHAQLLQPVGGRLVYITLCTCSYTWLIMLGGPTIGLVDYETGTQGYLYYNLPYAEWLLGLSTRYPVCWMYIGYSCILIPSTYGLLTPIVGSTPF